MTINSSPGFYGKFPELGDFVNRRIPRSFLEPWDEWLQGCIATSREQLGDEWLDFYLNSPIWRFVLSGGLCGEPPWSGVLMPSVDRVGRYYPLVIAQELPLDACMIQVASEGKTWFDEIENLLLSVLAEPTFDLDVFDKSVVALNNIYRIAEAGSTSVQSGFGSAWRIPLADTIELNSVIQGLAHQLVVQRLGPYSLWWSGGSNNVHPSMLVSAQMPTIQDFSTLLTGDWNSGTWEEWTMSEFIDA